MIEIENAFVHITSKRQPQSTQKKEKNTHDNTKKKEVPKLQTKAPIIVEYRQE